MDKISQITPPGVALKSTRSTHSAERIARLLSEAPAIKWVFAGDSVTQGAFHTLGHRDYVEHFAERIRWEKQRLRDAVITTAVGGWRITNIVADLDWSVLQHAPHVLSLNIGMNDCADGPEGLEQFGTAYRDALDQVLAKFDAALILHTPNAIYQTPEGSYNQLAIYAEEVRKISAEYGAVLVDHEKTWLEARARGGLTHWLSDEIHPNEYGHRAMAQTLLRALNQFDGSSPVCRFLVP